MYIPTDHTFKIVFMVQKKSLASTYKIVCRDRTYKFVFMVRKLHTKTYLPDAA
jgi:hypothetical protein